MKDAIRSIFKLKNAAEAVAIAGAGSDLASTGKALLQTTLPPEVFNRICTSCDGKGPVIGLALGLATLAVVRGVSGKAEAAQESALEKRLDQFATVLEDIQRNQLSESEAAEQFKVWVTEERAAGRLPADQADRLVELIPSYFQTEEAPAAEIDSAIDRIMALMGEPEERRLSLRVLANYDRLPKDISPEVRRGLDAQIKRLVPGTNRTLFSSLDEILDTLAVKPSVIIPVPEGSRYQDRTAQISRLRYAERLVPRLIGRDAELKSLSEFRDHEEKFLYWIWYGDGGLGKSRLALEWLYQSLALGWQGGFVQNGFPPQMDQWRPSGPTIFIVDYAESSASQVGPVLRVLQTNQVHYDVPVRVLLLDRRYRESLDFATSIHGEGDASTDADFSCVSSSSRPFSRARRLEPVSPQQFLEMFRLAVFNLSARRVAYPDEKLMEVFTSPEFDRRKLRPLYAGIAALAYVEQAEGSSFNPAQLSDWSTDVLEGFVLQREARIWKEEVSASQTEVHALTGACIMGSVPTDAEPVRGVDRAKVRKMASHTLEETDYLQPDPLAEALIRMRLNGKALFGDTPHEVIEEDTIELFKAAFLAVRENN
ncbi:hypothetical protein MCEMSE15_02832 [Fimbriimonadaceae bacterium]